MIDIAVTNVVKAFEVDKNILDGISFTINSGERVGILGKNGCGKTTLFRILVDEIGYDTGDVSIAPGKRVGLISQIPRYPANYRVEDVLDVAFAPLYQMEREMADLAERMGEDPSLSAQYDRLAAAYEAGDGYNIQVNKNRVCNGLNIPAAMRQQLFADLSGGEKTRVNLARLILEDTDILLLDEPTNHLDVRAVEWLENYLLHFKGTVLTISHDRYFLDRVVTRTIEIVHGKAEFYSGNYSFFVEEKQRRYEEKLRQYEKDQAKIAQLQAAADKLHLWAFMGNDKLHKRAFSMEKHIQRLQATERPERERKMKAGFGEREFHGDEILITRGLGKAYGAKQLFSDLELTIAGGERIALLGDNGTGKSTLLKIIMGEEQPDTGYVRLGPSVVKAYLPQVVHFDHPERSVLDTMIYEGNVSPQTARNRLGAFQFSGEDVFTPVSCLSGGEQSRLRLCILMKDEINFLILDEPTNHLDIASREWIESALENYGEALLFVSHDRYFISRFATRIWALEDGKLTDFPGGYEAYRKYRESQAKPAPAPTKAAEKKPTGKGKKPPSLEKQLQRKEREIEKKEAEIAAKDQEIEAHASDYQRLEQLLLEKEQLETELEALYADWSDLVE